MTGLKFIIKVVKTLNSNMSGLWTSMMKLRRELWMVRR